jgi:vacuolar protein sorting-associated protein VTA1
LPGGFTPFNPSPATFQTSNDGGMNSLPSAGNYDTNNAGSGNSSSAGGVKLNAEQLTKAQKYCKWAGSALNYDDIPTAITNLQKALKLLQTGHDG